MIHSDIQNQLQFLIKTSAPPLIEVADHATGTPQWAPGQRLPAHVLASLPNGRFEVRVGDQVLDLNLPRNTQAGDNIELVFIGDRPRLTFALSQDLAGLAAARTPVSLSEAARFLGSLVQQSAGEGQAAAAQLARGGPVLGGPPQSAPELAQSLRQAVTTSGLFYESHQAQWVRGERTVASLLQEPQGQLSPLLAQGGRASSAEAAASLPRAAAAAPVDDAQPKPAAAPSDAPEPVHPQTTPLVQQQLHALDSRQLVWHGQIWPGQDMQWEIEEDARRGHAEADMQDSEAWRTRLSLELPAMGGVEARITFADGGLRLELAASRADSTALMRGRQAQLAAAFEDSGLRVTGLSIQHEPAGR